MNPLILFALGGIGGITAVFTTAVTFIREHFGKAETSGDSDKVTITDSEGHTVELHMKKPVSAEEVARKLANEPGSDPPDPGPNPLAS